MQCVDCGAKHISSLGYARRGVTVGICGRCSLVQQERWSQGFDREHYDYYAERLNWSDDRLYPPINSRRIVALLESLRPRVAGVRLLDVGCGVGGFVRAATTTGWDAVGIDLSESALAICRRFALPCSNTNFFDRRLGRARYDVIVMSELIEHVPQPTTFLRRAHELLAPGGLVYVTTPNWRALGRILLKDEWRVIQPGHLSYFTPHTLSSCATRAGLRVETLSTTSLSLAAIRTLVGRKQVPWNRQQRSEERRFREAIERSLVSRAGKRLVNGLLNATQTGETIKATLRPGAWQTSG